MNLDRLHVAPNFRQNEFIRSDAKRILISDIIGSALTSNGIADRLYVS